jgi:hypothetical protein
MAIIDVGWPVPKDSIYGHVIMLNDIKAITPPLQLDLILPDEAPQRYVYFKKYIKVERDDQKLIEEELGEILVS